VEERRGSRAVVLGADEGTEVTARGSRMLFKAVAETTGGAFSLMERVLPPGGRPPPAHTHPQATEAFYLLAGVLEFRLGTGPDEERVPVGAGGFVLVPGDVAHTFANAGPDDVRLLILHAPALDGYFRDLHDLWLAPTPPTPAEERALMLRHGLVPAAG
jgi:quercetin dioxygenase-like cupin family protein